MTPQVQKLAEKYFGGWQSMSSLPQAGFPSDTEPLPRPEQGPRHFEQGSKAGPLLMQAYYRPAMTSKDAVLLDIIWSVPLTAAPLHLSHNGSCGKLMYLVCHCTQLLRVWCSLSNVFGRYELCFRIPSGG